MLLSLLAFLLLNTTVPSTPAGNLSTSQLKVPSAAASPENAAIIYSDHGGFMISVPKGWVLDRATGQKMGTCCVLYPQGSSWDQADSVIYPNIAEKQPGQTLQQLMANDLDGFRQRFPKMNVVEARDLPAGEGAAAKVRVFYGVNQGSFELVAYVDEPQVVALLVLSSRSKEALGEALPAFREVLKSYVYMDMTTGASVGLSPK
ncbi:MAG TPA: hypothetical protein VJ756_15955 [Terriglobales bacterium]|jgi:hypothetical protein|nr:hypothetical protein [Terriglobales bacterium]